MTGKEQGEVVSDAWPGLNFQAEVEISRAGSRVHFSLSVAAPTQHSSDSTNSPSNTHPLHCNIAGNETPVVSRQQLRNNGFFNFVPRSCRLRIANSDKDFSQCNPQWYGQTGPGLSNPNWASHSGEVVYPVIRHHESLRCDFMPNKYAVILGPRCLHELFRLQVERIIVMTKPAPHIWINGFPGVGKLTVARELQRLIPGSILVDNHQLIDVVDLPRDHPDYTAQRERVRLEAFDKWVHPQTDAESACGDRVEQLLQTIIFTGTTQFP